MKEKQPNKSIQKEVPDKSKLSSLSQSKTKSSKQSFIPKEVANRMARRVLFTTGLPTILGMGVFVGSYILITKQIIDVPPALTLTSSALCFLIGLIGLSYGILSASWDKNPGTILGLENIQPNAKRMKEAFRPVDSSLKKSAGEKKGLSD